jgi:flagellar biosynthesis protein FliQ
MKLVQAAANAAAVAGVLLAIFAAAAAVAAKTLAAPGVVVAALLAGGCAWVREWLLEFRHTQFISSKYQWQKVGGLSLVKGDPVKVTLSTE